MLFKDINTRLIRLTDDRKRHIEVDHPEMSGQITKAKYYGKESN